jgi:CDP-paratose 2-epimerase
MKILITGICGFVGSRLADALQQSDPSLELCGIDNLLRAGSETNRAQLAERGIRYLHGDVRLRSDVEAAPVCDWVIDAAANPSVLAGVDGRSSSRQLAEHNLTGTLNLLEYCREHKAGLILLSTSRVYSVRDLAALPVHVESKAFVLEQTPSLKGTATAKGIIETFPVRAPVSLYGATKLSSEIMALEYGLTFQFPVWVNRCGVLAGAGQFGTAEQGIFSYWLHAHAARRPLRYIGFGGHGHQVRDAFHPADLAELIALQLRRDPPEDPIFHASGGASNALSLAQLTDWCNERFGQHEPQPDTRPRPFDIPWMVMDSSKAHTHLGWQPKRSIYTILEEIEEHVRSHPDWLERCGVTR